MEKFKPVHETRKQPWSVTGGVRKERPSRLKKKLAKILSKCKVSPLPEAKEKCVPSKNRLRDVVTAETADVVDADRIKKKIKKTKSKSISTQTFMGIGSHSYNNGGYHDDLQKHTQNFSGSDSSSDDHDIHRHKHTQTFFANDIQHESCSESYRSVTPDIQNVKSGLEENSVKRLEVGHGKRKRKEKMEMGTPLVVEAPLPPECRAPPLLLQKFDTEAQDHLDAALKLFYESLMETSAEVSMMADTSDSAESDDTIEETEYNRNIDDNLTDSFNLSEESPMSFYRIGNKNQGLLLMKHPFSLFFKGTLSITVLRGCIEILGCVMDSNMNSKQTVYSPKGSSMLGIETCFADPPSSEDYELLGKMFEDLDLDMVISKDIIADIEHRSCVVLLEAPISSPLELYLKNFPREMHLFSCSRSEMKLPIIVSRNLRSAESTLSCVFEFAGSVKFRQYTKIAEWEKTSELIIKKNREEPGACTVICGGKSVGKSTFLRFLVNRNLSTFGKVLCLDFDPGQSEFTVPGCVSAVIVTQHLLGPNFTHLTPPECLVFVGEVNVAQCPQQYLDSARYIIDYCRSRTDLQKMPWIINTMGFNKGIGVDLTVSLLRLLSPHFVVQIQSRDVKLNFPVELSPGYVWQFQSRVCVIPSNFLQYSLLTIRSAVEIADTNTAQYFSYSGLNFARLREAMVLSYFSKLLEPPAYSLTAVLPFKTPLSKLFLSVCHASVPPSQILTAINGNLVALCVYNGDDVLIPKDPSYPRILRTHTVCPCLGFGVVRGIDLEEKSLFLLTPLSVKQLSRVNCLMMGAVTLPEYVYTQLKGGDAHIPYVATGRGQITSAVKKPQFRRYSKRADDR